MRITVEGYCTECGAPRTRHELRCDRCLELLPADRLVMTVGGLEVALCAECEHLTTIDALRLLIAERRDGTLIPDRASDALIDEFRDSIPALRSRSLRHYPIPQQVTIAPPPERPDNDLAGVLASALQWIGNGNARLSRAIPVGDERD